MKEIVILAGPNGAGKTTTAKLLLPKFPDVQEFLNADEFARALKRVERRVKEGGHGLAPDIIRRRYFSGLWNLFTLYLPLADELEIYDNSARRVRIAKRTEGGVVHILDSRRWSKLKRISGCEQ